MTRYDHYRITLQIILGKRVLACSGNFQVYLGMYLVLIFIFILDFNITYTLFFAPILLFIDD